MAPRSSTCHTPSSAGCSLTSGTHCLSVSFSVAPCHGNGSAPAGKGNATVSPRSLPLRLSVVPRGMLTRRDICGSAALPASGAADLMPAASSVQ